MSLHIYIAHSGEHLLADPVSFASCVPPLCVPLASCGCKLTPFISSPDALKSWIVRSTSIPPARQILMTARGKNVKTQTLATEVYRALPWIPLGFRRIQSKTDLLIQTRDSCLD